MLSETVLVSVIGAVSVSLSGYIGYLSNRYKSKTEANLQYLETNGSEWRLYIEMAREFWSEQLQSRDERISNMERKIEVRNSYLLYVDDNIYYLRETEDFGRKILTYSEWYRKFKYDDPKK